MKQVTKGKCAHSPNWPTTSNEDVRLNYGVFEGGRGVIDPTMRLVLADEAIDVGFRKSKRHRCRERHTKKPGDAAV